MTSQTRKQRITETMIHLWGMSDQAGFDMEIEEALSGMTIRWQRQFIERMLENGFDSEPDIDILRRAKQTVGWSSASDR